MAAKKQDYGNESISSLKGADRVRKRPGVIFGSDGLDGCEHAVFEILSNSIDEAREGHGKTITVTRFLDQDVLQFHDTPPLCPYHTRRRGGPQPARAGRAATGSCGRESGGGGVGKAGIFCRITELT